ncbi:MAG: 50S ribosomal protein L17 [Patescibacteria group bacterium]|jgi:large subunit ribosomal protein L17
MRKFGRKTDHRNHLIRNLATSLVLYETIDTTEAKAKEVKSYIDKVLARNKGTDFNVIRNLNTIFFDKNAVKKVIEELVPRFADRKSGFCKSYHLKNRVGDNSSMMRVELIGKKTVVKEDKKVETKAEKAEKTEEAVKVEKKVKEKVKK